MIRQNNFIYSILFSIFVFPFIDDISSYSANESGCELSVVGNESFYQQSPDFIIMEEKGEL
jgi:hypothetical protein